MSNHIHDNVLKAIEEGKVQMRSRRYFWMRTAGLTVLGAAIIFGIEYLISFILFMLRESGVAYALVFGVRGWLELWSVFPLMLLVLAGVLLFVLQWLVQRFSIGYRYAFSVSLGLLLTSVIGIGILLDAGALHDALFVAAKRGKLPAPVSFLYEQAAPTERRVIRGEVIIAGKSEWVVLTRGGTTTIVVTDATALPTGAHFDPGDIVVVIAEETRPGSIEAYGIRKIDRGLLDQAQ